MCVIFIELSIIELGCPVKTSIILYVVHCYENMGGISYLSSRFPSEFILRHTFYFSALARRIIVHCFLSDFSCLSQDVICLKTQPPHDPKITIDIKKHSMVILSTVSKILRPGESTTF